MSAPKKSTVVTGTASNNAKKSGSFKSYEGVFLFDKTNYMIMIAGVLVIALGFILMAGGKSPNPNEFHPETLYSPIRVTVAPGLILIGFIIQFFAILRKPKTVSE